MTSQVVYLLIRNLGQQNAPWTLLAGSVAYLSNLLGLFGRNGADGAMEGHNIAWTTPGRTSKCFIFRDACMFAGDLKNAYARACVLSTPKAVRDRGVLLRFAGSLVDFSINIVHKSSPMGVFTHD